MPEILAPRGALRKGDPHLHTSISDSLLLPSKTVLAAAEAGMHWIALTDHHLTPSQQTYDEALSSLQNTRYEGRLAVFKGVELDIKHKERRGHVAVFFSPEKDCYQLERSAISFLHTEKEPDLVDVAKWTRDENGVMLIAHPNQPWLISFPLWGVSDAISKIRDKGIEVAVGLEVVTASRKVFPHVLTRNASFAVLNEFAKKQGLAAVAVSDTHVKRLIGKAYTLTFADRVIETVEDEFANVQQAFKNLDTWPVTVHYRQMSFKDVTLLRVEMSIVELFMLVGRRFIKKNEDWDPFYAGRWLESKLRLISHADFELTQKLKAAQEAYRQEVFKEDRINQHIRARVILKK